VVPSNIPLVQAKPGPIYPMFLVLTHSPLTLFKLVLVLLLSLPMFVFSYFLLDILILVIVSPDSSALRLGLYLLLSKGLMVALLCYYLLKYCYNVLLGLYSVAWVIISIGIWLIGSYLNDWLRSFSVLCECYYYGLTSWFSICGTR
jgi:hypothetical protein